MKLKLLFLSALCFCFSASADVIILSRGQVIAGDVIQQDDNGVLVKTDSGTISLGQSSVKDVRLTSTDGNGNPLDLPETNRIPSWGKIVAAISKPSWAGELHQIPATVIDNGELKDVPYISFHCAGDCYEVNIYGDPDSPCGVEIGSLKTLANNERAHSNCVEFIRSILPDWSDKRVVRDLARTKEIVTNDDLTFEITLPNEPDAYGGWWVSIYNEPGLAKARASGAELLTITEPAGAAKNSPPAAVQPAAPVPTSEVASTSDAWSPQELGKSRVRSIGSSSGGRVYVRAYVRKDGTYVHAHTRSYPHHR